MTESESNLRPKYARQLSLFTSGSILEILSYLVSIVVKEMIFMKRKLFLVLINKKCFQKIIVFSSLLSASKTLTLNPQSFNPYVYSILLSLVSSVLAFFWLQFSARLVIPRLLAQKSTPKTVPNIHNCFHSSP